MKTNNQFYQRCTFYIFGALALAACSSGGGGSDDTLSLDASIVPLTCSSAEPEIQIGIVPDVPPGNPDAGKGIFISTKLESGTDGDINFDCTTNDYDINGGTITITQVKRDVSILLSEEGESIGKVSASADYAAGTQVIEIDRPETTIRDCIETYVIPVPETITDPASLKDLATVFKGDGDPSFISGNCPDEATVEPPISSLGSIETIFLSNFEVTDDMGAKHLVSIKNTFTIDVR